MKIGIWEIMNCGGPYKILDPLAHHSTISFQANIMYGVHYQFVNFDIAKPRLLGQSVQGGVFSTQWTEYQRSLDEILTTHVLTKYSAQL